MSAVPPTPGDRQTHPDGPDGPPPRRAFACRSIMTHRPQALRYRRATHARGRLERCHRIAGGGSGWCRGSAKPTASGGCGQGLTHHGHGSHVPAPSAHPPVCNTEVGPLAAAAGLVAGYFPDRTPGRTMTCPRRITHGDVCTGEKFEAGTTRTSRGAGAHTVEGCRASTDEGATTYETVLEDAAYTGGTHPMVVNKYLNCWR